MASLRVEVRAVPTTIVVSSARETIKETEMDGETVRTEASKHGEAVAKGDMATAGSSLAKEAYAQAGEVMKSMPDPIRGAEVTSVESDGDRFVAKIAYRGDNSETVVASTWEERDGQPKIVGLQVV
jgi:hypothetical protein